MQETDLHLYVFAGSRRCGSQLRAVVRAAHGGDTAQLLVVRISVVRNSTVRLSTLTVQLSIPLSAVVWPLALGLYSGGVVCPQ